MAWLKLESVLSWDYVNISSSGGDGGGGGGGGGGGLKV